MTALWNDYISHFFTGGGFFFGVLLVGVGIFALDLLLLMETRWGQTRLLRKCLILSVWFHVLLCGYLATVKISFGVPVGDPGPAPIRVRVGPEPPPADLFAEQNAPGLGQPNNRRGHTKPWETFSHGAVTQAPKPKEPAREAVAPLPPPERTTAAKPAAIPDSPSLARLTAPPPLTAGPQKMPPLKQPTAKAHLEEKAEAIDVPAPRRQTPRPLEPIHATPLPRADLARNDFPSGPRFLPGDVPSGLLDQPSPLPRLDTPNAAAPPPATPPSKERSPARTTPQTPSAEVAAIDVPAARREEARSLQPMPTTSLPRAEMAPSDLPAGPSFNSAKHAFDLVPPLMALPRLDAPDASSTKSTAAPPVGSPDLNDYITGGPPRNAPASLPDPTGAADRAPPNALASSAGASGMINRRWTPGRETPAARPGTAEEDDSGGAVAGPAANLNPPNSVGKAPEVYRLRTAPDRERQAEQRGASPETETAVRIALQWLSNSQNADGRWTARQHEGGRDSRALDHERPGAGMTSDTGITGLALLSLLASGHTHRDGQHHEAVRKGLEFLVRSQADNGSLSGQGNLFDAMYCHGIASFALSEALGMTADDALRGPVERAIGYTLRAQDPKTGGWRYRPGDPGDTSQMGWQFMALKSAELAGIPIPETARNSLMRFLQSVASGRAKGLAAYRPGEAPTRTMTAEAILCWQFLGMARNDPAGPEAGDFIITDLPSSERPNFYYWYYGTLAAYQLQGDYWQRWNEALRRTLVAAQHKDGPQAGSWDPDPLWGSYGGRIYSTSLGALCLEVYYRFLPLYREAAGAQRPK